MDEFNIGKSKSKSLSESGKIQETFLNHCRKARIPVILQCHSGQFQGIIVGFDQETIIIEIERNQQLFYKSALISILPQQDVNFIFNDAVRYRNVLRSLPEFNANYS